MFPLLAWGIALLIDCALLVLSLSVLFGEKVGSGSLLFGGMSLIFGVLVAALIGKRRQRPWNRIFESAKHFCWLLPVIALTGSFDSGMISGLELLSVVGAAAIGGINWVALTQWGMKHA